MMQKKSQSGMNAAILVAIIAGLIILYVVFLPTSERQRVLGDDSSTAPQDKTASTGSNILLQVSPGQLDTANELESEKKIPDSFLVETVNAVELLKINPFAVRNGWFDKKNHLVDFSIDDPDNTDNVFLSFTPKKHQGILSISLNNRVIYENDISGGIVEPVRLDKILLSKKNALDFSVSGVGAKFWSTNEYSFENVKIIGDITDVSKQESTNIFSLSESEYASIDKAYLKFTPYCGNINNIGTLDILINGRKLFSSLPVCDKAYKQSMPKTMLTEGENNIVFKTEKGSYSIEQIRVSLEFKEPKIKTYYFEVSDELAKNLKENKKKAVVTLKFTDDKLHKRLKLDVNGKIDTVDTSRIVYSKDISSRLVSGNNFVKVEPFDDIDIVELKVQVE